MPIKFFSLTFGVIPVMLIPMDLKTYLSQNNISYKKLAEDLHKHPVYVNGIVNGTSKPGPKLVLKICAWTNGEVQPGSLRPDIWENKSQY